MPIETRIFKNTRKSLILLKKRFHFLKEKFSLSVLFLFIGFFLGNIFGTFLNWLRHFIIWDGLLVFALLLFFEIISSIVYQKDYTFSSPTVSTNEIFKTSFSDFFIRKNFFYKIRVFGQNFKRVTMFKTSPKSTDQLNLSIWRLLNCLKVGLLFGFFIDAFKVGS